MGVERQIYRMADDKEGRDKKAHDAGRRQREREVATELSRGDEPEPPVDAEELAGFEMKLESLEFPVTGSEVVATIGDHVIETTEDRYTVDELVPAVEEETFDSPAEVRMWVQRPTIAAAMTRILEAVHDLPNKELGTSQREAYEKTFRELEAIDADDDDEGIQAISDWIINRIQGKNALPGSRDVRRQAAKFCRANGYEVRDDDWLGI